MTFQTACASPSLQGLDKLAEAAIVLGHDIVSVSGFVDQIDAGTTAQGQLIAQARDAVHQVSEANSDVLTTAAALVNAVSATMRGVATSSDRIRQNSDLGREVATWVQTLDARMLEISGTLKAMQASAAQIAEIALQVNILAINAKIEAARAGDAGRGFSVVAEEVNSLSRKTANATESIRSAIEGLAGGIGRLRGEAEQVAGRAGAALSEAEQIDRALQAMSAQVVEGHRAAEAIAKKAEAVHKVNEAFIPLFAEVIAGSEQTAAQVHDARAQLSDVILQSEGIVQLSVELGANTSDSPMIELAQDSAHRLSRLLERAVDEGRIDMDALFDMRYRPIPGTNPQQVMAPFTELTDRLFPEVQEEVAAMDERIVFCAAVDRNGYLPTHNLRFSQPQRNDPVWNAANCRNRRIFDDRVGLGAGRNIAPFLMQIYRRDMGGGRFAMMKDVSAPIRVKGRHWGGLRLAYTF